MKLFLLNFLIFFQVYQGFTAEEKKSPEGGPAKNFVLKEQVNSTTTKEWPVLDLVTCGEYGLFTVFCTTFPFNIPPLFFLEKDSEKNPFHQAIRIIAHPEVEAELKEKVFEILKLALLEGGRLAIDLNLDMPADFSKVDPSYQGLSPLVVSILSKEHRLFCLLLNHGAAPLKEIRLSDSLNFREDSPSSKVQAISTVGLSTPFKLVHRVKELSCYNKSHDFALLVLKRSLLSDSLSQRLMQRKNIPRQREKVYWDPQSELNQLIKEKEGALQILDFFAEQDLLGEHVLHKLSGASFDFFIENFLPLKRTFTGKKTVFKKFDSFAEINELSYQTAYSILEKFSIDPARSEKFINQIAEDDLSPLKHAIKAKNFKLVNLLIDLGAQCSRDDLLLAQKTVAKQYWSDRRLFMKEYLHIQDPKADTVQYLQEHQHIVSFLEDCLAGVYQRRPVFTSLASKGTETAEDLSQLAAAIAGEEHQKKSEASGKKKKKKKKKPQKKETAGGELSSPSKEEVLALLDSELGALESLFKKDKRRSDAILTKLDEFTRKKEFDEQMKRAFTKRVEALRESLQKIKEDLSNASLQITELESFLDSEFELKRASKAFALFLQTSDLFGQFCTEKNPFYQQVLGLDFEAKFCLKLSGYIALKTRENEAEDFPTDIKLQAIEKEAELLHSSLGEDVKKGCGEQLRSYQRSLAMYRTKVACFEAQKKFFLVRLNEKIQRHSQFGDSLCQDHELEEKFNRLLDTLYQKRINFYYIKEEAELDKFSLDLDCFLWSERLRDEELMAQVLPDVQEFLRAVLPESQGVKELSIPGKFISLRAKSIDFCLQISRPKTFFSHQALERLLGEPLTESAQEKTGLFSCLPDETWQDSVEKLIAHNKFDRLDGSKEECLDFAKIEKLLYLLAKRNYKLKMGLFYEEELRRLVFEQAHYFLQEAFRNSFRKEERTQIPWELFLEKKAEIVSKTFKRLENLQQPGEESRSQAICEFLQGL